MAHQHVQKQLAIQLQNIILTHGRPHHEMKSMELGLQAYGILIEAKLFGLPHLGG